LKHDNKVTSYQIALLRAINDIVLSFPGVLSQEKNVVLLLRMLAELRIAYYWPFTDAQQQSHNHQPKFPYFKPSHSRRLHNVPSYCVILGED
jgi:hypothetical protein